MNQIIGGVVSGFAVLIVAAAVKALYTKWQNRAFSDFWQFMNPKVFIVHPIYYGPNGEKMPPNMARIEDILATELLIPMLRSRGIEYRLVDHSEQIPPGTDKILVCSPKGNQQSALFATQVNLPYEFRMEEPSTPYFLDTATGVEYWSPSDKSKIDADFALIGRYTDKKASRKVFLLWGIHGVGTLAAAKFALSRRHVSTINRSAGRDDFVVLIKGHYLSTRVVGECEILAPVKRIARR